MARERGRKFELPEDILWHIESIKCDKRRLSPEKRLVLAAMLIDLWVEMRKRRKHEVLRILLNALLRY